MSGFFYAQNFSGEKFIPIEERVSGSPSGTTALTINVRVFLCPKLFRREVYPPAAGAQLCPAEAMRKRGGTTRKILRERDF